jgi:putative endonuclease
MAYLSGLAAEDIVEKAYLRKGMALIARRWRGTRAEIDMIFADGAALIFVEVKKSRSFDAATRSLGRAQCDRILEAATEFLGRTDRSQLTEMRFDLATVDKVGAIDILENAFALEG